MPAPKIDSLPDCFGEYESEHPTCDGDDDEDDPCPIRDHCVALILRCKEAGTDPDDLVEERGVKVLRVLDADIEKFGIVDGEASDEETEGPSNEWGDDEDGEDEDEDEDEEDPEEASESSQEEETQETAVDTFKPASELWRLFGWFMKRLLDETGLSMAEPDEVPIPGQVYDRDHAGASRYLGVYLKVPEGKDTPLARVRFRPRKKRIDIRFPVDVSTAKKAAGKKNSKKLGLRECASGKFKCEARGLDREGAALAAELVARLKNDGEIAA